MQIIKPRKAQKLNMVFLYSEKCSENDSDMTLNLIIARNIYFVKNIFNIIFNIIRGNFKN